MTGVQTCALPILQIAVYSTTALPIIVAVTQVAVNAGAMSQSFASTLVLAGVVSVLVMPTLGLALGSQKDKVPANEALGVVQGLEHDGGDHVAGLDLQGRQEGPQVRLPLEGGHGDVELVLGGPAETAAQRAGHRGGREGV